ncbi:serine hydrolase [Namhaeicola litoreus]|uniref:beta-lactamase n=1 Tax=Namhaeicola litoreus TaxID=1052145 RepID=A0ABW3Y1U7_9FLAO
MTFFLFQFLAFWHIGAQESLPLNFNGPLPKVQSLRCHKMQEILKSEIDQNKRWKKLISNKKMSISIVDLHDPNQVTYAGLNDNQMMYAASLPKIAVLLAAMDAINNHEIVETDAMRKDMKLMISKSNNQATTRIIDLLGFEKIESSLRNANHKLYDETTGGGLWVGKRYASTGKRYPDPLKGLSHGATSAQVASFYYQLVFGRLINQEQSKRMLEVLKDPALTHKFVNTLKKIAPESTVYRKSGSWKTYHSDSVLVWGKDRKYILVALIDDGGGEQIIRDLVVPLESVISKSRKYSCN